MAPRTLLNDRRLPNPTTHNFFIKVHPRFSVSLNCPPKTTPATSMDKCLIMTFCDWQELFLKKRRFFWVPYQAIPAAELGLPRNERNAFCMECGRQAKRDAALF